MSPQHVPSCVCSHDASRIAWLSLVFLSLWSLDGDAGVSLGLSQNCVCECAAIFFLFGEQHFMFCASILVAMEVS